ncbi:hypothetical protein K8I61_04360 [bacterium]|nr:hypothetical protein [bacterium]
MTWIAEERGLGGAKSLDGLAWDLSIEAVWEAWVAAFSAELSQRLGFVASPFQTARRSLRWSGSNQSMGSLMPDVELRAANRAVFVDAKYKSHYSLIAQRGWQGLTEKVRDEHRADIHQALAYTSLADVPQVDSLLIYPQLGESTNTSAMVARVTSGRRVVRLILVAVPFGYRNLEQKENCLNTVREFLVA